MVAAAEAAAVVVSTTHRTAVVAGRRVARAGAGAVGLCQRGLRRAKAAHTAIYQAGTLGGVTTAGAAKVISMAATTAIAAITAAAAAKAPTGLQHRASMQCGGPSRRRLQPRVQSHVCIRHPRPLLRPRLERRL